MAWARRCDLGCETWPDQEIFRVCMACREPTERFHNADPDEILSIEEAYSRIRHTAFEKFYEHWCRAHDQPTEDEGDLHADTGEHVADCTCAYCISATFASCS